MKGLLYTVLVAFLVSIILMQSLDASFLNWRVNYLDERDQRQAQVIDSLTVLNDSLYLALHVEKTRYNPETVWLARGIYSETDRVDEMEYVAWVIRNRVELKFRGRTTYRGVVTDPWQFSAFNYNNDRRWYYINKSVTDADDPWLSALDVAHKVMIADTSDRPIPITTTHFYSEVSMNPIWRVPRWVKEMEQVTIPHVEEKRFRFYSSNNPEDIETL